MRDLALLGGDLATRCLCPFIVIARFCASKIVAKRGFFRKQAKRSFFRKQGEAEVSLVIHRIKPPRIHF